MNVKKLIHIRYLAKYYPEKLVMRHKVITLRLASRSVLRQTIRVNANWVYNREHGYW